MCVIQAGNISTGHKMSKMQLKWKQVTGTFFMVLWSLDCIVAKWKGLWLAFGAEERILLRFALLRSLPLNHFFYVILPFSFPIHLPFLLVSTSVLHCLWHGHTFWSSLSSALKICWEKKKQFCKIKRLLNKLLKSYSNNGRQTSIGLWHLIWILCARCLKAATAC